MKLMTEEKYIDATNEDLCNKAINIVRDAKDQGITLRILGAMAVYIHSGHSPEYLQRYMALERLGAKHPMFTDLDFMAYAVQRKRVTEMFENHMHFRPNLYVNALFGNRRNIFHHPEGRFDVDIFFDSLVFSHEVKFCGAPGGGRLELDFPTISLADIVLEKLQIHHINRKDLVDLFMLFWVHEISEGHENEKIDARYIARVLSDDWGFEYDAKGNLGKLRELSDLLAETQKVTKEQANDVNARIKKLMARIDSEPKSKAWLKRAKKGISKPWFQDVEEVER
jgi:hypothetical protein